MAHEGVARAPWLQLAWQESLSGSSDPCVRGGPVQSQSPTPSPKPNKHLEKPGRKPLEIEPEPPGKRFTTPSLLGPVPSGGPREIDLLLDHLTSPTGHLDHHEAAAQALARLRLPSDDRIIHRWLIHRRDPGPDPDLWRLCHAAWIAWDVGRVRTTRTLNAILALIARCLTVLHQSRNNRPITMGPPQMRVDLVEGLLRLADPMGSNWGRYPKKMVQPVSGYLLDKSRNEHLVGSIYPLSRSNCPIGRSSFERDVLRGEGMLPHESQYGQKFNELCGWIAIMDYESQTTLSSMLLAQFPEYTKATIANPAARSVTKQSCHVLVLNFYESGYMLVVKMTLTEFSKRLLVMEEKLAHCSSNSNETSDQHPIGQDVIVMAQDAEMENRFHLKNRYFRGVIINLMKSQYLVYLYDLGVVARINVTMPTMKPLPSSLSPLKLSPLCKYLRVEGVSPQIDIPVQDHATQVLKHLATHLNSEIFTRIENFTQVLDNLTYSDRQESMEAAWSLHHIYFKEKHQNLKKLVDEDFRDIEKDQALCTRIAEQLRQGHVNVNALSTLFCCLDLMRSKRFQETWTSANLSSTLDDLLPKLTDPDEQRLVQRLKELHKEGNLHQKRERVEMAMKNAKEKKMRRQSHPNTNCRSGDQSQNQSSKYFDKSEESDKKFRPLRSLSYNALKDCSDHVTSRREKESNSVLENRVTAIQEEIISDSDVEYIQGNLFKAFNRNVVFLGGKRVQDIDFYQINQHIVAFLNVHTRGVIFLGIEKGSKSNVGNITGMYMNRRERDEFRVAMDQIHLQGHIKPKFNPDSLRVTFNVVKQESRTFQSAENTRFVVKIEVKENTNKSSFFSFRNCHYVIMNRQIKEASVDDLRELFLGALNVQEKTSLK